MWDLRSSIFSGAGNLRGVGARPQTRFLPPKDEFTRTDSKLVDCAFSFDESSNRLATLDTHGVIRIWDVRKPSECISSFEACLGGGVGVDCMPSRRGKGQFVTWGTDAYFGDGNLVVKLWREQESTSSNLSKGSEIEDKPMGDSQDNETRPNYKLVSRVSMERGQAARVHPSFRDGVLVFRDRDNSYKKRTRVDTGLSTPVFGPHDNMSTSPRLCGLYSVSPANIAVNTPPSPPSLMLEDETSSPHKTEISSRSVHMNDSWKAELWAMPGDGESMSYQSDVFGAVQLSSFGGGRAEEDVLSFNNDKANVSSVMAVDLSLSDAEDGDLSLYCLTKKGRVTLYTIPEVEAETKKNAITRKREEEKRDKSRVNEPPRAHRQDQWWNKEEEDDLFGSDQTRESSTKEQSLRTVTESSHKYRPSETGRSRVSPSHDDENDLSPRAIDEDPGHDSILNENHQKPIDLATAARAPCPPLCGAVFGPSGEVLFFNNGPVSRLWSLYSSGRDRESDVAAKANSNPRTLSDLIEMKQETEKFEWGAGDHRDEDTQDDASSSGEESSYEDDAEVLDEDLESSEGEDSDGYYHVEERINSMYDGYFASSRKSLLNVDTGQGRTEEKVSLPSLAPFVSLSLKHSESIICGQSPNLASRLDVGDTWWLDSNFVQQCEPAGVFSGSMIDGINSYSRSTTDLIESSDLPLSSLKRAVTLPSSRTVARKIKSLFVSQDSSRDDKPFLSPESISEDKAQMSTPRGRGVYTLESPPFPEAAIQQLDIARRTCLHNAQVFKDFGQPSKACTWTLLAQTVDSIAAGADVAITSGLVEEIIRHYANDVQMLATITCVLTLGRDRRRGKGSNSDYLQLLPDFGDCRYENYLLSYANLLYRWGHLVVRAEVLKRLAHPQALELSDTSRVTPRPLSCGVSFLPVCAQCTTPVTDEGTNFCRNCNDFAFRCSISDIPIRGRFAWCPMCRHGGDPLLMNEWFSANSTCPTGCGCECRTKTMG